MNFVDLSSGDKISDATSRTTVIDPEMLDVVPLAVIPPHVNVLEIIDISDSMRSYEDGGNEIVGPRDYKNL